MIKPTDKQIRNDNPHFGPVIRVVEPIAPYQSKEFDFTHSIVVGAKNSEIEDIDYKGNIFIRKVDAWATYLWSPSKCKWVLGAN